MARVRRAERLNWARPAGVSVVSTSDIFGPMNGDAEHDFNDRVHLGVAEGDALVLLQPAASTPTFFVSCARSG